MVDPVSQLIKLSRHEIIVKMKKESKACSRINSIFFPHKTTELMPEHESSFARTSSELLFTAFNYSFKVYLLRCFK